MVWSLSLLMLVLVPMVLNCGIIQSVLLVESSLEDRVNQQCPSSRCRCEVKELNVLVHCEKFNLDYVQDHLPMETTHFYFRYNQLNRVTEHTFQETLTPNLHTLDLSHCNITTIDEDTFKKVTFKGSLAKLILTNNNLSETKQLISVIKSLPKLEYIDLRNNTQVHCLKIINYFKVISNIYIHCDKSSSVETTPPIDPLPTDLLKVTTIEIEVTTPSTLPEETTTTPVKLESVTPPETTLTPNDSDSDSLYSLTIFWGGIVGALLTFVFVIKITISLTNRYWKRPESNKR